MLWFTMFAMADPDTDPDTDPMRSRCTPIDPKRFADHLQTDPQVQTDPQIQTHPLRSKQGLTHQTDPNTSDQIQTHLIGFKQAQTDASRSQNRST